MPDTQNTKTPIATPDEGHTPGARDPSPSRLAAAAEAAYILEAVRR